MTDSVLLRDVIASDLPIFFEQQFDPVANQMAAFLARGAGSVHGALGQDHGRQQQHPQGHCLGRSGRRQHRELGALRRARSGLLAGPRFLGQGIATQALSLLLEQVTSRPLYAHVANSANKRESPRIRISRSLALIHGRRNLFLTWRNWGVSYWQRQTAGRNA